MLTGESKTHIKYVHIDGNAIKPSMCILLNVQESEKTSAFVYLYSYDFHIVI